jgi:hypothetical protein
VFSSCNLQKNTLENSKKQLSVPKENNLNEIEINIINDFLDTELKKERYKPYQNMQYVVIEKSIAKIKAIDTYIYSYNEWLSMNRINKIKDTENRFFLDSLRIKKLKAELENEKNYHWKVSDFKNISVSFISSNELIKMINSGYLFADSGKLLIELSTPLIIDENTAFLSYEISNCRYVCNHINHFTVLMKKVNNKWSEVSIYYDGVYY